MSDVLTRQSPPVTPLLRLAAETLRVHVNEVMADSGEEVGEREWDALSQKWLGGPVSRFCALMSPRLALALAEAIDEVADSIGQDGSTTSLVIDLAHAILRERGVADSRDRAPGRDAGAGRQ